MRKIEAIIDQLDKIKAEIITLREEWQSVYDDASEKWQESEKGEAYSEKISNLEEAENYCDEALSQLESAKG